MSPAARIHVVRHGETPGNAARILQVPETPLSARGLRQAEALASRFAAQAPERIVASDLLRARMTAEAVGAACGVGVESEPLLRERDFGSLRGTPYAELDCDPFAPGYTPPGGESWPVFDARVDAAWRHVQEIADGCGGGDLLVVTHGLVCHALANRHWHGGADVLAGASASAAGPRFANTCVTTLAGGAPWQVEVLACTAHLEGEARASGDVAPV